MYDWVVELLLLLGEPDYGTLVRITKKAHTLVIIKLRRKCASNILPVGGPTHSTSSRQHANYKISCRELSIWVPSCVAITFFTTLFPNKSAADSLWQTPALTSLRLPTRRAARMRHPATCVPHTISFPLKYSLNNVTQHSRIPRSPTPSNLI